MRNAFASALTKLAQEDQRIVLLSGNIGNKLFDSFKERCPPADSSTAASPKSI
jgi:transketolase